MKSNISIYLVTNISLQYLNLNVLLFSIKNLQELNVILHSFFFSQPEQMIVYYKLLFS